MKILLLHLLRMVILVGLIRKTRAVGVGETPNRCTFIQLVIDESGSMEDEQEFIRDDAMPQVVKDLRLKYEQTVFVCSWGFAYTNRGRCVLT